MFKGDSGTNQVLLRQKYLDALKLTAKYSDVIRGSKATNRLQPKYVEVKNQVAKVRVIYFDVIMQQAMFARGLRY